jgi:hypothetical protein
MAATIVPTDLVPLAMNAILVVDEVVVNLYCSGNLRDAHLLIPESGVQLLGRHNLDRSEDGERDES